MSQAAPSRLAELLVLTALNVLISAASCVFPTSPAALRAQLECIEKSPGSLITEGRWQRMDEGRTKNKLNSLSLILRT
ncbi:hypothetical protein B0H11DRAFT_197754 [Mycena galericulata]|nr:hypothetical protein B0H11DRAFT_197754 [Mycena galericulata]